MKVYRSEKYCVIGYLLTPFGPNGTPQKMWVLQEIPSQVDFKGHLVVIDSAKFIKDGNVYFLEGDGRIEDRAKRSIDLLTLNSPIPIG